MTQARGPAEAQSSVGVEAFPYGKLAMISSVCFASAISFSGLFPYAGFMVADLMHISPNESGFYAGYLSAAMMLGRMFSSVPWGVYADTHGRKPTLLIGLISIALTSVSFGFSQNMYMALASRFLLGLFNPIIAIGKTLVSEVTNKEQEAQGMAVLTGTWGVGLVFGPALGGMLSRPVLSYPGAFVPGAALRPLRSLLLRFPYLLPNLCTALYAVVEFVVILLYFEETLVKPDAKQAGGEGEGDGDVGLELGRVGLAPNLLVLGGGGRGGKYAKLTQEEDPPSPSPLPSPGEGEGGEVGLALSLSVHSGTDVDVDASPSKNRQEDKGEQDEKRGPWYLLRTFPTVRRALAAYFLLSMVSITFDEVMPLWALSSVAKGGLEYSNVDIGEILSYTGAGLILYTMLIFPRLAQAIGPMWCFRCGLRVAAPLMVFCSCVPSLLGVDREQVVYVALVACVLLIKLSTTTAFTANALLINNSVPAPSYRASVNGLAMSLGSGAKTLGPCVGATLFAWSIKSTDGDGDGDGAWSGVVNFHFVFVALAVISLVSSLVYSGELTVGPLALSTSGDARTVFTNSPAECSGVKACDIAGGGGGGEIEMKSPLHRAKEEP